MTTRRLVALVASPAALALTVGVDALEILATTLAAAVLIIKVVDLAHVVAPGWGTRLIVRDDGSAVKKVLVHPI